MTHFNPVLYPTIDTDGELWSAVNVGSAEPKLLNSTRTRAMKYVTKILPLYNNDVISEKYNTFTRYGWSVGLVIMPNIQRQESKS